VSPHRPPDATRPHPDGRLEGAVERLFAYHAELLLRWPRRFALGVGVVTLLLFAGMGRLTVDVRLNAFVVKDNPDYLAFHHLRERFDNDELLLVVIRPPAGVALLDPAMIASLGAVHDAATALESVAWVSSLARARHLVLGDDAISFERWIPAGGVGEAKATVLADPQVRGRLAGRDGESLILRLGLRDSDSPTLVTDLHRLLSRHLPPGSHWATVGTPVIKQELRRALLHDVRLLVPAASAGSFLLLALGLGSLRRAVAPLATALLASGWTLGIMGWVGAPLTVVSAIAPALILVLALTDAVHVTVAVHRDGVRAALLRIGPACVWTSATTAAGFLGLAFMGIPALVATGVWMAIGVTLGFFHAMVALPLLLHLPAAGNPLVERASNGRLPRCGRPWLLVAIAVVFLGLLLPGIGRLDAETDMVRYFPADGALRVGYRDAEAALGGSIPLSVMVERRDGGTVLDEATLGDVVRLRDALKEQPQIASLTALPDLLATLRGEGNGVVGEAEGAQLLLLADLAGGSGPARTFIDPDHRATRLLLLLPELSSARMVEVARGVKAIAERLLGDDYRVTVAGTALHEARMMNLVSQGLKRGMAAALAVIGLLFWALMGSWRWGLAAILPNLLPVGGVLGIMGWTGLHLDFSTAMIGTVALGLAVDDTIHLNLSFRHARGRGMEVNAAIEEAVCTSGVAVKLSTWVLVGGFALLALSTFAPTRHFGLLTCVCLSLALVADIWLFPALVLLLERDEPPAVD